ncbi:hypothetical protein ACQJBY_009915 [Aegilops geniculata]
MTKWGAWNTASSFCWRLIQLEPVIPSDLASVTEQQQLISDKYPWQHVMFGLRYELAYRNEVNHYYWYLKILRMLVVQTVQVATEILDSEFSLFVVRAFLFGLKQWFPWTPYTARFLLFYRTNSAPGYFSVSDRRRFCCLVLLDVFRVLRDELMLVTGIQPRLSECQPVDWFHDVFLSVCNTYTPEPTLAKFQVFKKCDCKHLISTGACNLFMDKGCLKCDTVQEESDSIVLQTSMIQCVQPRYYFEVGSTQAYLKLKEVDVAVTYMFELRNNWDWELLTRFNCPPDPASIWECITGRTFPWNQILLIIFHPWPPTHVTCLMGVCCCGSRAVTRETSCIGTLHTHAGSMACLNLINNTLMGSEAIHGVHVNYKSVQYEYFTHGFAHCEIYLEKFALMWKKEKYSSNNSVFAVTASFRHSNNNCSFQNILLLTWVDYLEAFSVLAHLNLDTHWCRGPSVEPSTVDVYQAGHQSYELHSDYLLFCAIELFGSHWSIYQLVTPWDPGGIGLWLLFKWTRQTVFQGGRDVVAITVGFLQGYVDHKYYHDFDNDYFGFTCDWIAIGHGYYNPVIQVIPDCSYHHDFELVKEYRVQWDPGGSRWLRLGVKPNIKKGGMLAALLTCMHMGLATGPLMDLARPLPHRCSYKYQIEGKGEGIQWINETRRRRLFSYLQLSPFLFPSSL